MTLVLLSVIALATTLLGFDALRTPKAELKPVPVRARHNR